LKIACLLFAAMLPAAVQAQFTYTTNGDNTITITGYTGSPSVLTILIRSLLMELNSQLPSWGMRRFFPLVV
jgi:hypothetical protein